jgi:hypothetical protein
MRDKIDNVVAEREAREGELIRDDGSRFYGDEEHAERMEAIQQQFGARMDEIEVGIGRKITQAEENLLKLEHADPTDTLTTAELERANAKREFVSDECWALSLEKLAQRCRAVLASGDRVNTFLYAHHAAQRVGERVDAASQYLAQKHSDGGGLAGMVSEEPGAQEVREVVAELQAKLDPGRESRLGAARKTLEEVHETKNYAYYRRRGARNAVDLYKMRKYNRGGEAKVSVADSVAEPEVGGPVEAYRRRKYA